MANCGKIDGLRSIYKDISGSTNNKTEITFVHHWGELYAKINGMEYSIKDVNKVAQENIEAIKTVSQADAALKFIATFKALAELAGKSKGIFQRIIGAFKGKPDDAARQALEDELTQANKKKLNYVAIARSEKEALAGGGEKLGAAQAQAQAALRAAALPTLTSQQILDDLNRRLSAFNTALNGNSPNMAALAQEFRAIRDAKYTFPSPLPPADFEKLELDLKAAQEEYRKKVQDLNAKNKSASGSASGSDSESSSSKAPLLGQNGMNKKKPKGL